MSAVIDAESVLEKYYPRHPRTGKLYYDPWPGGRGMREFLLGKERAWWTEWSVLWARIATDMITGAPCITPRIIWQ